ncbi:ATP-binding protein [Paludisphaera mucosa]|uniref:histidine kinase n=1 Tax=Paludisphaera mucosa TaxID=3030827 RepID=A0ABT6F8E7_9BACT|nr:ATP-binding protein [Paludisphaera mucosa]MDG3003782.1 ATP-binding protein [Paludisphaera mucosa]
MSRMTIRWRLTLWYGAVLAAVLTIFAATVDLLMIRVIQYRTDSNLDGQLAVIEDQIGRAENADVLRERLAWQFAIHPVFEMQVTEDGDRAWLRSERIAESGLPMPAVAPDDHGEYVHEDVSVPGLGHCRMLSKSIDTPYASLLVQVALDTEMNERHLGQLRDVFLSTGPILLLAALGCGYLLAWKALSPVEKLAAEAQQITATRLDRRLATPNPDDELGRLARTLNGMIARLERSFGEIQRFTADAAHELRSPLAALRSEAEVTLMTDREPAEYRRTLESMLEEIEHLTRLTTNLLYLCREDALVKPSFEDLRLDVLVQDVTEHMRAVAAEAGQRLVLKEPIAACVVYGDSDQLRRLLLNLIDNAVKYTPADGEIRVGLEFRQDRATLVVEDTGIGIAAEHIPHIFKRFYRIDSARPRKSSATGLGLSICQAVAKSHHGAIELKSEPGVGTRVICTFPARAVEPGRRDEAATAAALQA